jgi:hypothetical protein
LAKTKRCLAKIKQPLVRAKQGFIKMKSSLSKAFQHKAARAFDFIKAETYFNIFT